MAFKILSACLAEIKANPGKFYVYVAHRPNGLPFYVGKGVRRRITAHEEFAKAGKKGHRYSIIRRAWQSGLSISYSIEFFAAEISAFARECELIARYGRRTFGGLLVNETDGGEGMAGYVPTASTRALIGEKSRAAWQDKASVIKRVSAMREAQTSPAYREASRLRALRLWSDPEFRKLMLSVRKGGWKRRANRPGRSFKEQSEKMLQHWSDPDYVERNRKAHEAVVKSDAYRSKVSQSVKKLWSDPEFRARMMLARKKAQS